MKKRAVIIAAAVVVVVVASMLQSCSNDASDEVAAATPADAGESSSTEHSTGNDPRAHDDQLARDESTASAAAADQPPPSQSAREATALRLADGDSFDIVWSDSGDRDEVRLIGLNAPEGDACFGDEARAVLASLIDAQTLRVDGIERDEFGRVLADVWVGDLFVNAEMIERGAALALSDGAPHARILAAAQARAQGSTVGLWGPEACGADPSVPLHIATIEYNAPGPDNENPNGEWIEVANAGASQFDLTGWSIRDESTRNRYRFPAGYSLDAESAVRVFSGCGTDTRTELYWCARDPVWNNGGDTGFLVDPDGRFGDQFSYSS